MLNVTGVRFGFVEEELQPRRVFENDAVRQLVLDVAVSAIKRAEGALFLFRRANHAHVNAPFLEVGADLRGGDRNETAIAEVQLQHDLADLTLDQFRDSFNSMAAHGNDGPRKEKSGRHDLNHSVFRPPRWAVELWVTDSQRLFRPYNTPGCRLPGFRGNSPAATHTPPRLWPPGRRPGNV